MGADVQHYNARAKFLNFLLEGFDLWDWIAEHYDFSHTKSVLEVACATGDFWTHVSSKATTLESITLTDHSQSMLDAARKTLEHSPLVAKIKFEMADVEALPYPEHAFDAVFTNHLMFNPSKAVPLALKEMTRVLKKDGWLGIGTINMRTVREILALANKIDPRFPAQSSLIGHFDENAVDVLLPKYFNRVQKFSYEAMMRLPNADLVMGFIRTHPVSLSLGLKEDFFSVFEKAVDSIIVQKGSLETVFTPTLYICKSVTK